MKTIDEGVDCYAHYRGRCKEMAEEAIAVDPSLALVRGHYHCPFWGEQPHWWTIRPDGTIYDPTALQFPSKGIGHYEPFDGTVACSNCGKKMLEDEASYESNYVFCSYTCHGAFVGIL